MRRWFGRILFALLAFAILGGSAAIFYRMVRQSRLRAATRIDQTIGLESLEGVHLNGVPQWMLVRSQNTKNPPLLFVGGGPGFPLLAYARKFGFDTGIEHDFTVVYWEQRGAGKSQADAGVLQFGRYVEDVCELGRMLESRFNGQKAVLAGHSWGTYLAVRSAQKCPERFQALVAISLYVNPLEGQRLAHRWLREQAQARGDAATQQLLRQIGEPPFSESNAARYREVANAYGAFYRGRNYGTSDIVKAVIDTPEYGFRDLVLMFRDPVAAQRAMTADWSKWNLLDGPVVLQLPLYILHGKQDWTSPAELAQQFFEHVAAAGKEIIWFENAAHMIPLEEPDEFRAVMQRVKALQPVVPAPEPETPKKRKRRSK